MAAALHIVSADPAAVAGERGAADGSWDAVTTVAGLKGLTGVLAFGPDWREVVGVMPEGEAAGMPAVPDASAFILAAHAQSGLTVELAS